MASLNGWGMRSHFLRKFKYAMSICFESIAGSGKTTQTKLLADYLKNVKGKEISISLNEIENHLAM